MFVLNYIRNLSKIFLLCFIQTVVLEKLLIFYPDEEPRKYGNVNRFVHYYCCILLLFIVLLMIQPPKTSENDTLLYLPKTSENHLVSKGSINLTLETNFLSYKALPIIKSFFIIVMKLDFGVKNIFKQMI